MEKVRIKKRQVLQEVLHQQVSKERRRRRGKEEGSRGLSLLPYQLILLSSNSLVAAFARFDRL